MRPVRNAPPTVEVVDVGEPVGDGELVRVASTGICASDLNYLKWASTQIAGHEFAGTLEDGSAVAVEAIFGCGVCSHCDEGNYNHCERGVQGLGITDPGAMCEWFRAPRRALVPRRPRQAYPSRCTRFSRLTYLGRPAAFAWPDPFCRMAPTWTTSTRMRGFPPSSRSRIPSSHRSRFSRRGSPIPSM